MGIRTPKCWAAHPVPAEMGVASLAIPVKTSVLLPPDPPSAQDRCLTSLAGAPEMGRRRATRRRKWAAQSVCSRPSGLGSERCAPEAASAATSWGSRQHGAVGAGEAPGPGRASGAGGFASEARALTARLSPLQSRHQKRARAQAQLRNLEAYAAQPHSFVFTRGRAGRSVQQLSLDVRRVMEPLTATRLQVCTPLPARPPSSGPGVRGCSEEPRRGLGARGSWLDSGAEPLPSLGRPRLRPQPRWK